MNVYVPYFPHIKFRSLEQQLSHPIVSPIEALEEEFRKSYLRTLRGPDAEERAERLAKERVRF